MMNEKRIKVAEDEDENEDEDEDEITIYEILIGTATKIDRSPSKGKGSWAVFSSLMCNQPRKKSLGEKTKERDKQKRRRETEQRNAFRQPPRRQAS